MNLKLITIILLLSLFFFFGFKKISSARNETKNQNIEELKILKYIPKENKLLFFSNLEISEFIKDLKKESRKEDLEKMIVIKNSLLGYLGIDLGKNKLEDVYDNELAIATYDNKIFKDDVLILFKIKAEKNLNDLLNLPNNIYNYDSIITIYIYKKLN